MPVLEYDERKSQRNLEKHGIDFVEAQLLWRDPDRVEGQAMTTGEPRWMVIGRIKHKLWSAVITYRGNRIRIISVRRARIKERAIYERQNDD